MKMASKELCELSEKIPLLVESCVNISLRVIYFKSIYADGEKDVTFNYYDSYTDIIEILVYDLVHFTGVLCAETGANALGLRNIQNLWNKVIQELLICWSDNDFSFFQKKQNETKLKNINQIEFQNRKTEIVNLFRKITKSASFKQIQDARNKVTSHHEIFKNNNNLVKFRELYDFNIKINDTISLWNDIAKLIKNLYEIVSGCKYGYDLIFENQTKRAIKFAALIPVLNK
jgi:hypothetical protein